MGEEISKSHFDPASFDRFSARLKDETALFSEMSAAGALSEDGFVAGFEIEA